MKKILPFLLVLICFCNCREKKETISFVTLKETEFNATPFEIPNGKIPDSLKRAHDSCMGFSFDANAMLGQKKDTFFIGSIVNRRSLKVVNTVNDLGLAYSRLINQFNVLTNPCYERRILQFPLKSLLGENFMLRFPNVDEALNKEINDAIKGSFNADMQTGSWVYLDMKDALKNIMDTISSPEGLRYKNDLLDTSNMVLTSVESVTDVGFIITTGRNISTPLQAFLKNKPSLSQPVYQSSIQLFYIDSNKFQMTLNGFFPVVGEFMKAELR